MERLARIEEKDPFPAYRGWREGLSGVAELAAFLAVVVLATLAPALRASHVSPAEVLREE
jgi:ABC-type lipoprotein release transport system permease subunit